MTVARTKISLTTQMPAVSVSDGQIQGAVATADDFAVTASSDSSAAIYIGGLIPWRLCNESGGSLTFTFKAARTLNGTALTPYDADGDGVVTMTLGDDCEGEIPSGLSGVLWLVIVGSGAGSGITLICKR
jgi:hypothetical protein